MKLSKKDLKARENLKEYLDYTPTELEDVAILDNAIAEWSNPDLKGVKTELNLFKTEKQKVLKQIAKEEKAKLKAEAIEQAKQDKQRAKDTVTANAAQEQDDRDAERLNEFIQIIKDNDLYHVSDLNQMYSYATFNNEWSCTPLSGFKTSWSIISNNDLEMFMDEMRFQSRTKITATSSFNPQPLNVLNLMDKAREQWVTPVDGPVNKWIDSLLWSVGNGNQKIVDFIEECIAWKYNHPEDYKLPAMILFGQAAVGKNEFVNLLLSTIFGASNVLTCTFDASFVQFSGSRKGKLIVLIDELTSNKKTAEKLKAEIGNKTNYLNTKFGKQGEEENIAWTFISSNARFGVLMLDGTKADRRYSVIRVDNDIFDRAAEFQNVDRKVIEDTYEVEAETAYTDPAEVGYFLHRILEKYKDSKKRPVAWHDNVYHELVAAHEEPHFSYARKVFGHVDFNFISYNTFYEGYSAYVKSQGRATVGAENVKTDIKHWLQLHGTIDAIPRNRISVQSPSAMPSDPLKQKSGFGKDIITATFKDADTKYYKMDKYENLKFDLETIETDAVPPVQSVTAPAKMPSKKQAPTDKLKELRDKIKGQK